MCELFGVSSKKCVMINDYLEEFYSHANQHPHGWGLAIMQENQSIVEKQAIKANESEELKKILSKPLIVEHAFAHIRLATMGYADSFNCHPFTRLDNAGRTWTLIHNGTIFNYEPLNKYISKQVGDTDSERVLLYLVDKINEEQDRKNAPLNQAEIFKILDKLVIDISRGNKVNLMLFDGAYMYVHANYKESLYYKVADDTLYISTTPLSDKEWLQVPINRLVAIKNSQIVYRGMPHNNEYEITQEHFNFILDNMSPEERQKALNEVGDLNYAREYQLNN